MFRRLAHAARVVLLPLAALLSPDPAHTQADRVRPQVPRRVSVTVALSDTLPAGASGFVILRRTDADPRDVILLRRDADSTVLSAAVDQLLLLRQVQGDTASTSGMVRVRPREGARRGPPVLPWAGRVVADVRGASPRTVSGVGVVPAVVIWLPPQRRRSAAQP